MKKLIFLIGLVFCVSCTASPEVASTITDKRDTQTLQNGLPKTTTIIQTPSQTKLITLTKESINTLNPTEEYEIAKAERFYFYFREYCKGYTIIENISPDLKWSLCATSDSIILRSYEDKEWEISIFNIYKENIDEKKVAPIFWSNDGIFVYIEYYSGDETLQPGKTIAVWRVNLTNGHITEILASNEIKKNSKDYAYTYSISSYARRLAYHPAGRDITINIIDLFTDESISFNMGRGYVYDSLFWSPDESKLAFVMAKETSYPEAYTNDVYLIEFPEKVMRLICSKSINELIVEYYIESITNDVVIVTDGNNRWKYEIATGIFSIMQ
jgi:hypothetical protein